MEIASSLRIFFGALAASLLVLIVIMIYLQRKREKTLTDNDPLIQHNRQKIGANKTKGGSRKHLSTSKTEVQKPLKTHDRPPIPQSAPIKLAEEISEGSLNHISHDADKDPTQIAQLRHPSQVRLPSAPLPNTTPTNLPKASELTQSISKPAQAPSNTASQAGPLRTNSDDIVLIRLVAREGRVFSGADLLQLLKQEDLHPGEHRIFHHYSKTDDRAIPHRRFSVCNGIKPGTLEVGRLEEIETPLLFFFVEKYASDRPVLGYNLMIQTASRFADVLDARLYTQQKKLLTQQKITLMRHQLQEDYVRTLLQQSEQI